MQVVAADPFYRSPTFMAAAAVAATLIIGLGTMWATLRATNPKRSVRYTFEETRLVHPHDQTDGSLEIRWAGTVLGDPRVVRVRIRNNGRRDVGTADFDGGRPIEVGFRAPILDVLSTESSPPTSHAPSADRSDVHADRLLIKPGRIGRDTEATYSVLVDGEPAFEFRHPLMNVRVSKGIPPNLTARMLNEVVYPLAGACFALFVILFGAFS
ncbi:hypothetical protein ACIOHS_32815 [Streptomyces sp. NPDC088253]|uniref:hypothetical protein n=1 Tax=Streptomyces sp. NPDC088253 TaxID=3365846 RepID=UPI0037F33913